MRHLEEEKEKTFQKKEDEMGSISIVLSRAMNASDLSLGVKQRRIAYESRSSR